MASPRAGRLVVAADQDQRELIVRIAIAGGQRVGLVIEFLCGCGVARHLGMNSAE